MILSKGHAVPILYAALYEMGKITEEEINKLRMEAPQKITQIAKETSSELIQKLIGTEINNSSISAIVDDLSKRNGNKYYDN